MAFYSQSIYVDSHTFSILSSKETGSKIVTISFFKVEFAVEKMAAAAGTLNLIDCARLRG